MDDFPDFGFSHSGHPDGIGHGPHAGRALVLRHTLRNGVRLAEVDREATLSHIRRLWGHVVRLEETPIAP